MNGEPGVKSDEKSIDDKSIEKGVEGQKCWLGVFSGSGCHYPNRDGNFFWESGVKSDEKSIDEKSIEKGLEGQKCWLGVFSGGGCHDPNETRSHANRSGLTCKGTNDH